MSEEKQIGIMDLVMELEGKVRHWQGEAEKWKGKYYWALSLDKPVQFYGGLFVGCLVGMGVAGGIYWWGLR